VRASAAGLRSAVRVPLATTVNEPLSRRADFEARCRLGLLGLGLCGMPVVCGTRRAVGCPLSGRPSGSNFGWTPDKRFELGRDNAVVARELRPGLIAHWALQELVDGRRESAAARCTMRRNLSINAFAITFGDCLHGRYPLTNRQKHQRETDLTVMRVDAGVHRKGLRSVDRRVGPIVAWSV
jgi:hypothetical protein